MTKKIVILTGAGISAESGIPVFRSETGLWEQERIEDVCVPAALRRDPLKVHGFYNKLRRNLEDKKPNAAHLALARLQKEGPGQGLAVTLITQNVDNLHEKAGSEHVIHMHGALQSIWCTACGRHYPYFEDSSPESVCKFCGKKALRPDIVFFEEVPYFMDEIEAALASCDLLMAIGTSGVVYPAAGFAAAARYHGAQTVEFNLTPSNVASNFTDARYGKASETVPAFVDELLSGTFVWQR